MSEPAFAVQKFLSRGGIRVYGMPVETFPGHVNNIYLIVDGDTLTLVDVGSGTDESVAGLRARIEEVRQRFGERISLDDVRHVVITHAHIDHFGWVGHFTRETGAVSRSASSSLPRTWAFSWNGPAFPASSETSSRRCIASPRPTSSR
jgi:glyoxylase-like metal-dependent hydrolase (beta-lactamase superfamily II)